MHDRCFVFETRKIVLWMGVGGIEKGDGAGAARRSHQDLWAVSADLAGMVMEPHGKELTGLLEEEQARLAVTCTSHIQSSLSGC